MLISRSFGTNFFASWVLMLSLLQYIVSPLSAGIMPFFFSKFPNRVCVRLSSSSKTLNIWNEMRHCLSWSSPQFMTRHFTTDLYASSAPKPDNHPQIFSISFSWDLHISAYIILVVNHLKIQFLIPSEREFSGLPSASSLELHSLPSRLFPLLSSHSMSLAPANKMIYLFN